MSTDESMNEASASKTPLQPYQYFSSLPTATQNHGLDLTELDATVSLSEAKRQDAFDVSSRIKVLITRVKRSMEKPSLEGGEDDSKSGDPAIMQELESLIQETLPTEKQAVRLANLSLQFQEYARLKAYQHFLCTGELIPPSMLPPNISDEEYLAGAVIGLTQDLARYVIGRATARDGNSVVLARNLVDYLLSYLMKFNFRNGMLRRKYDGVKYALKTCETVLYELSVTGLDIKDNGEKTNSGDGPASKRMKTDIAMSITLTSEEKIADQLEKLRVRIERRDDLRETLIKRCRDAQKAAKQAIFALHRNDFTRANKLITQCENIINSDLNPIVEEDPSLHFGSYSNVLEEYAEAKLFQVWLSEDPSRGRLLTPKDFDRVSLEPTEYLGGLCDLTGEIGRIAVQRGTKRDSEGVQFCLETNLSIMLSLETLQRFPSGNQIFKKMDQLKRTVEKLERMLYELSLVQATGREIIVDSVNEDGLGREGEKNSEK